MNCTIAPSVLGLDHANMRARIGEIIAGGASMLHFDVMDGQFVPPISFGDALVAGLRDLGDVLFEAHLMTQTPERHFEAFARAGCGRIIFHAEATPHAHRLAQTLRAMGVEPGIAINPGTAVESVRSVLDVVDLVLVMTVNPGWGAQKFIAGAMEKVRAIRTWRSDVHIEVDGGIDEKTLPVAREAGANVFVVGNYLVKQHDLGAAMRELNALCV
jgi:ribulose-phosphate 3-epimerase